MAELSHDDALQAYIREVVHRESECIEQACEASLQSGLFGVLVTTKTHVDLEGYKASRVLHAEVSPDVPYGEIHYRTEGPP